MAIVVSKADALVEMVKAHDNQETKKANKIGQILSKSIQKDSRENACNAYIGLDKESKQLFPMKVRQSEKKPESNSDQSTMVIEVGDNQYEIEIEEGTITIKEKKRY